MRWKRSLGEQKGLFYNIRLDGLAGRDVVPLDAVVLLPLQDRARRQFGRRIRSSAAGRQIGDGRSAEDVADGFIRIAVANMVEAIKKIFGPARL